MQYYSPQPYYPALIGGGYAAPQPYDFGYAAAPAPAPKAKSAGRSRSRSRSRSVSRTGGGKPRKGVIPKQLRPWMSHLAKYKSRFPGNLGKAMKAAKATWKKKGSRSRSRSRG
jgi:hypothetical protein